MKTNTVSLLFVCFFTFFALLPKAQAVVPPPDGGYPGRNTAEGNKALFSLTTGTDNTALGWLSLQTLTTGSLNTGVGAWTLALNTADNNTACGGAALLFNGTGTNNTAVGTAALLFNTMGEGNTATGAFALYSNTEGDFNTANGEFALSSNTSGERNTAIGDSALNFNTEGSRNTAVGNPALLSNTTGSDNTAIGFRALWENNSNGNTAIGSEALSSNSSGNTNTATGFRALANSNANQNTANGYGTLLANTTGAANTGIGFSALDVNTTGSGNTAVGWHSLSANSTGQDNTALGKGAGSSVGGASNVICIGAEVAGADVSNSCYIGNIFGATSAGGVGVIVNAAGKLGTNPSSQRFKEEVKSMAHASEALFALKPVTFRYKKEFDPTAIPQFGLVAEEVEKINPDLIVRDKEGNPYSVRYEAVNAMLLNEFLKEYKKVEEQQATIAELKSEIQTLTARLDQQAAQIQKVSVRVEASKPDSRIAVNDP